MLRSLFRIAALGAGAGFLVGCPGRIQGEGTLFVEKLLAPQAGSSGYTDDPSQPSITTGVVDLALPKPYEPTYLLGSQFATEGAADVTTVDSAMVSITDASGNQLDTFTALLTTTVAISPLPGSTVGYAPATLSSIDLGALDRNTALQDSLARGGTARLVTHVTFFGQSTGDTGVQSDEFAFPLDVCRGCLSDVGH